MKEREDRKNKNIRVMLKDGEESYPGIVTNFSKTGMSIKTDRIFPTYRVINVLVKIGQKVLPLKGSVRWVNEAAKDSEEKHEMGILLHNPPDEYLEYFD